MEIRNTIASIDQQQSPDFIKLKNDFGEIQSKLDDSNKKFDALRHQLTDNINLKKDAEQRLSAMEKDYEDLLGIPLKIYCRKIDS